MWKRIFMVMTILFSGMAMVRPTIASAYNFGDYRSTTLVSKAWAALKDNDLEAVLAYTNKCIQLYGAQAKKMEASLNGYVKGSKDEIFAYWALNDVSTAYFIQGEAYRKANMMDEAKAAYQKVVSDYTYGQCWDTGGWFWKPADAAKEKLQMIASGSNIDFGDYKSVTLTTKAWKALQDKDLNSVLAYTNKCIQLYAAKAKKMQNSLSEYPWESKDKIFSYWALNDVGTCLFIQGSAYMNAGDNAKAKKAFKTLVDNYYYAQCWDPKGWFWKPSEAAQQKLDELNGNQPSNAGASTTSAGTSASTKS